MSWDLGAFVVISSVGVDSGDKIEIPVDNGRRKLCRHCPPMQYFKFAQCLDGEVRGSVPMRSRNSYLTEGDKEHMSTRISHLTSPIAASQALHPINFFFFFFFFFGDNCL